MPEHDRLAALEVQLERSRDVPVPVRLRVRDASGRELATSTVAAPPSGSVQLAFPPVAGVVGDPLIFCLEADAPSGLRAWYADDLSRPGQPRLEAGAPATGTLAFQARYEATPAGVTADAANVARRYAPLLVSLVLIVLGPGLLVVLAIPPLRGTLADVLAAAPGAAVLVIAFGWWLAYLAALPITAPLLAAGVALCLAVALVLAVRSTAARGYRRDSDEMPRHGRRHAEPFDSAQDRLREGSAAVRRGGWMLRSAHYDSAAGTARAHVGRGLLDAAWLVLVWLAALVVRLAVIRDLALPAWVDGVEHTYLVDLMMRTRGLPDDYGPLLGFGPFNYHFGFHVLAASAGILSGAPASDAVLAAGQFLSAAAAPAAYLLVRAYGGRPLAALVAATTAGLVSVMPAYYVSWSRFTQLAGLVAAPTWLLLWRRASTGPSALAAGLAGAALLLVHPRVAVMAALLALVDLVIWRRSWRVNLRLALGLAAAAAVAAPWLWRIAGGLVPRMAAGVENAEASNALDFGVLSSGHDPPIYALAAAVVIAGVLRANRVAVASVLWAILVVLLANSARLGLSGGAMLGNAAVAISLWLPAAALVGAGVAALLAQPARRKSLAWLPRAAAPVVVVAGCLLADRTVEALNPATVLATPRDRAALATLAELVPSDALVAVNSRDWQYGIHAGVDAGYWIGVVTPGRAIVPPVLYALAPVPSFESVSNRLAGWEAAASDPVALVAQMRQLRADWLFVGERGGAIDANTLTPERGFDLVLADGGARLYRLRAP